MTDHERGPARRLGARTAAFLLTAACAAAAWYGWLGWDHVRDERPDGQVTGPYEAWQVVGLVAVLAAVGVATAWRGHPIAATFGTAIGLTAAVSADWSAQDDSGLWLVGATMVLIGSVVVGGCVTGVTFAIHRVETAGPPDRLVG